MRPYSKFCAGRAATSNSISKAKQTRKPLSSTPRDCSWKVCGCLTNPIAKAETQSLQPHRSPNLCPYPARLRLLLLVRRKTKRTTFFSMADPVHYTAAVITVSDSRSRGDQEDKSGPALIQA